jgi:4-amino-4-deoxy-L-arabinose transferase-like glycosyltransferase
VNLGLNDLIAGDEGYYGVMARNIATSRIQLVNPSLSPLGPPGDKPFLYPLILAGALAVGGIDELPLRIVTLAMVVASALLLMPVGRALGHAESGRWAALLMLCSPHLAHFGRRVAAEAPLVTFGLIGMWLFLSACRSDRPAMGAAAGAAFGLGFLCKLWLVAPIMLASIGAGLRLRPQGPTADTERRRRRAGVLGAAAVGFGVVGSLQLVLCALTTPETLPHWLRIYVGFSLAERMAGTQFADYWHKPWHYYLTTLSQSIGLWLPLLALGVIALATHVRRREESALPVAVALWWLPLPILSAFAVKSGNYLAPMIPGFALVCGAGIEWLRVQLADGQGRRGPLLYAGGLALTMCMLAYTTLHGRSLALSTHPVTAMLGVAWIAALATCALARIPQSAQCRIATGGILALTLLLGLARDVQIVADRSHVTGYARLAARLAPGLRDRDPREPCFFAPEAPSMAFYTFRTGRYWESPYVSADVEGVRSLLQSSRAGFFIIAPATWGLYGGQPDSAALRLVHAEAHLLRLDSLPGSEHAQCYLNAAWTP